MKKFYSTELDQAQRNHHELMFSDILRRCRKVVKLQAVALSLLLLTSVHTLPDYFSCLKQHCAPKERAEMNCRTAFVAPVDIF